MYSGHSFFCSNELERKTLSLSIPLGIGTVPFNVYVDLALDSGRRRCASESFV